jgi:hypothetical protein
MQHSHTGFRGIPWHRCDRCGCDTPTNLLRRQRGLILCLPNGCFDDPTIWNRPGMIQSNLAFGQDTEMAVADILKQDINEDMEDEFGGSG